MSKKILKNSGALILITVIMGLLLLPALHPIKDPSFSEMKDIEKFQLKEEIEGLKEDRNILIIFAFLTGMGSTLLLLGIIKKENHNRYLNDGVKTTR